MPDAILQCTEAAGAEFEASLQKSLLRVRYFVSPFNMLALITFVIFIYKCQSLHYVVDY